MCAEIVESTTRKVVPDVMLPTQWGLFRATAFERKVQCRAGTRSEKAVALTIGEFGQFPPLVRIHSQCLTGDVLGSLRCDCGAQLSLAMEMIRQEGSGIVIYEEQEGRGIGLMAKLRAYALQDHGLDTVEANECLGFAVDYRDYVLPVEILRYLNVSDVRLLSNNPMKYKAVVNGGIRVVERIPCEVAPSPYAERYLLTKKEKLGHQLVLV